jgi:ferrous iron transport protein A
MVLMDARPGSTVKILEYHSDQGLESKLRQLGLMPGDSVRIIRKAPLGGPILMNISGREIALGESIAAAIVVMEVG